MPAKGQTGTCGLTEQKIAQLNEKPIRHTMCDVCKVSPGRFWFGLTSAVTCGSSACVDTMQRDFDGRSGE